MDNVTIFRPRSNLIWGLVALTLIGLFAIQTLFYPSDGQVVLLDLTVAAGIATAATLLWIRPKLILQSEVVVVVNPLSKQTIAYSDILELETKWALLIRHRAGETRVWVAPANGKQRWIADSARRWKFNRVPSSETADSTFTSVSQSLGSDSGIAATLIRDRMNGKH